MVCACVRLSETSSGPVGHVCLIRDFLLFTVCVRVRVRACMMLWIFVSQHSRYSGVAIG